VSLPLKSSLPYFNSLPRYTPTESGNQAIWAERKANDFSPDSQLHEDTGAVYIFSKNHQKVTPSGIVLQPQSWTVTEHAKIQPSDTSGGDEFGSSMSLNGIELIVGSPMQDGFKNNAGAVYFYSVEFSAISFEADEYYGYEGSDAYILVVVKRDLAVFSGDVHLEYGTSDLSAKGVDRLKYTYCMTIPPADRGPLDCGDYLQASGRFTIFAGDTSGEFKVYLIDDLCHEKYPEYIQVTLSVPGSNALQGSKVSAKLRIDDDDFLREKCSTSYVDISHDFTPYY